MLSREDEPKEDMKEGKKTYSGGFSNAPSSGTSAGKEFSRLFFCFLLGHDIFEKILLLNVVDNDVRDES